MMRNMASIFENVFLKKATSTLTDTEYQIAQIEI